MSKNFNNLTLKTIIVSLIILNGCSSKTSIKNIKQNNISASELDNFRKEISSNNNFIIGNKIIFSKNINFSSGSVEPGFFFSGQTLNGFFASKTNIHGDILKNNLFFVNEKTKMLPLDTTEDDEEGNYVIIGYGKFDSSNFYNAFAINLNNDLNKAWGKIFSNGLFTFANNVFLTNNYLKLWGSSFNSISNSYDISYLNINKENGEIIDSKAIEIDGVQFLKNVVEDTNDFYINGIDALDNVQQIFLTRIDKFTELPYFYATYSVDGKLLITKILKKNNNIYFFGQVECCKSVKKNAFILQTDLSGKKIKAIMFGGSGDDIIYDALDNDSNFVLSIGSDSFDFYKDGVIYGDIDYNLEDIFGLWYDQNDKIEQIYSFSNSSNSILGVGRSDLGVLLLKNDLKPKILCPFEDTIRPRLQDITSYLTENFYDIFNSFEDIPYESKNMSLSVLNDSEVLENFLCYNAQHENSTSTIFGTTEFVSTDSSYFNTSNNEYIGGRNHGTNILKYTLASIIGGILFCAITLFICYKCKVQKYIDNYVDKIQQIEMNEEDVNSEDGQQENQNNLKTNNVYGNTTESSRLLNVNDGAESENNSENNSNGESNPSKESSSIHEPQGHKLDISMDDIRQDNT